MNTRDGDILICIRLYFFLGDVCLGLQVKLNCMDKAGTYQNYLLSRKAFHFERERETDRQTDRQIDRQMTRQTDSWTDKRRERERENSAI